MARPADSTVEIPGRAGEYVLRMRGNSMVDAGILDGDNLVAEAFPRGMRIGKHTSDNALATRHPFDCGSRCFLCHYDKLVGGGSRRAREKREAMKEADHGA